jgi:hypothetical protein
MTPSVVLDPTTVRLEAGTSVQVPLQIRNTGDIVEGYHMEVVGPPAAWTTVEPDQITLFPGDMAVVNVDIHPPRSAKAPAGEHLYGVRVVPTEHPEEAVVPEGAVEVLPFLDLTAELVPRTSHGRRGGRHEVAVDNRGNAPVDVNLTASDPADALTARVRPETVTVDPGQAEFADVRVRPARTVWRGAPVTHPFTVLVAPQDGNELTLDGTHVQVPVIPAWLPKAAIASLVVLAALAGLWYGLLKRTIDAAALSAVKAPVAEAKAQAGQANNAAQSAQGSAVSAAKSATTAKVLVGSPPPRQSVVSPFRGRLDVSAPEKGSPASKTFTVPKGQTLDLTDFVFENPQGDFGTMQLTLGNTTLFNLALENFRTNDFHFIAPIEARAGQLLTLTVQCNVVGVPPGQAPGSGPTPKRCATGAFFGGTVTEVPKRP